MPRDTRAGFALPMALFVLLVTTGAVLTSLSQSSTERRVIDDVAAGERALHLAESALAQLDDLGFDFSGSVQDSTRVTFAEGYADVMMRRVRAPVGNERPVFVLRARGVHAQAGIAGAPDATRMVTRLAEWVEGTMEVHAGWTSLTGLRKNGNSGSLSGVDNCGEAPPVAGVAVPSSPGYSGHTGPVSGSPPIKTMGSTPRATSMAVVRASLSQLRTFGLTTLPGDAGWTARTWFRARSPPQFAQSPSAARWLLPQ